VIFSLHRESWGVLSLYGLQQSFAFVHWSDFFEPWRNGIELFRVSGFVPKLIFQSDNTRLGVKDRALCFVSPMFMFCVVLAVALCLPPQRYIVSCSMVCSRASHSGVHWSELILGE
jgi:hypothetical protein